MERKGKYMAAVEAAHGKPFWEVVAELHARGMERAEAARALGYPVASFQALLYKYAERDPWPRRRSKVVEYTLDTGEPFRDAVQRLAATHTENAAARELGYTNPMHLRADLEKYGIAVTFRKAGVFELGGVHATLEQHARRAGLKPITLYKRIRRHGLVERVITDPLDAAQSARNRSKRA